MRYTVVLVPGESATYVAYVPVIPGCVTQGDTIEEALAMAADAATGILAIMAEDGDELPVEAPGAIIGSVEVLVPALAPA